jgi:hypothetical protein
LPGLFTGVGIIGTFWGLIQGLQAFKVSDDAGVVRTSLEGLMHHVSDAFLVSATAIIDAMIATFVEKMLVAALYRKAEELTFELDSMFESGAGEEYLARLVKASEDSADQSKMLKDALVTDLSRVLTSLTDRQIQAHAQGSQNQREFIKVSQSVSEAWTHHRSIRELRAIRRLLQDCSPTCIKLSQRLENCWGRLPASTADGKHSGTANCGDQLDQMASTVEAAGTRTSQTIGRSLPTRSVEWKRVRTSWNRHGGVRGRIRNLVQDSQAKRPADHLLEISEAVGHKFLRLKDKGTRPASHSGGGRRTPSAGETAPLVVVNLELGPSPTSARPLSVSALICRTETDRMDSPRIGDWRRRCSLTVPAPSRPSYQSRWVPRRPGVGA